MVVYYQMICHMSDMSLFTITVIWWSTIRWSVTWVTWLSSLQQWYGGLLSDDLSHEWHDSLHCNSVMVVYYQMICHMSDMILFTVTVIWWSTIRWSVTWVTWLSSLQQWYGGLLSDDLSHEWHDSLHYNSDMVVYYQMICHMSDMFLFTITVIWWSTIR